jgi:hypothetical protein
LRNSNVTDEGKRRAKEKLQSIEDIDDDKEKEEDEE